MRAWKHSYARVNDDEWSAWITKTLTVSVDSSIASRFTDMDFSPEVQQRLNKIAAGLLAVNAGARRARRWRPSRGATRARHRLRLRLAGPLQHHSEGHYQRHAPLPTGGTTP